MTDRPTSLLLIGEDATTVSAIETCLGIERNVKVTRRDGSLSSLNGSAAPLAAQFDFVVFSTDPGNEEELAAIRELSKSRAAKSVFFALTSDDIPLSQARMLSKCGVDDVMPSEIAVRELPGQIETWREKRKTQLPAIWTAPKSLGKLVTIAKARGGVGSTMVAVNLADELRQVKKRFGKTVSQNEVVILDLDFQFGTVGSTLDVPDNEKLMQMAAEGFVPSPEYVRSCVTRLPSGLSVMPAPSRFAPLEALRPDQIEAIIDELRQNFAYVIVDLPRALVSWIDPVLAKTDKMFLVTDVTVPSIRASRKLMDFIIGEQPQIDIEIVVNFEKRPLMHGGHHREAAKLLQRKLEHWLPNDRKAAREVLDRGCTLSAAAPRSELTRSLQKLARQTIRKLQEPKAGTAATSA